MADYNKLRKAELVQIFSDLGAAVPPKLTKILMVEFLRTRRAAQDNIRVNYHAPGRDGFESVEVPAGALVCELVRIIENKTGEKNISLMNGEHVLPGYLPLPHAGIMNGTILDVAIPL